MDWLVDNKVYLNILFLVLAVISFVLILRPILFWYFGQNKILNQVKNLQDQIDQQNRAIEKLLSKVETTQLNNLSKALPAPSHKLESKSTQSINNNVVNITKEHETIASEHKEISTNRNSKSHFERKEPTLKL